MLMRNEGRTLKSQIVIMFLLDRFSSVVFRLNPRFLFKSENIERSDWQGRARLRD